MSTKRSRPYMSQLRSQSADATKGRVLRAARTLFATRGIDKVPIAGIAKRAGVSVPTVYALYKSKEGILRALIESSLFGQRFQEAIGKLKGVTDAVKLIELTPSVARAIYEGESSEMGLIRGASAFSAALRKMESELEKLRFSMQKERVELLFAQGKQRKGLPIEEARRILWMYTSRDVYRLLVHEGGWTPDRYEQWLSETLVYALIDPSSSKHKSVSPGRPNPA